MSLPHNYVVTAIGGQAGSIQLGNKTLPELETNAPVNFGGPEGFWTPEDLFVGAVADCFILTFRAISRMSKLEWLSLTCDADGTLDKVGAQMLFTEIALNVTLTVADGTDTEQAERLLHRSEQSCLVTNSLKCPTPLQVSIKTA